jgi:hypothetical protein
MSLVRAGGITALVIAVLTTAALTAFSSWYTASTTGEFIGHILLFFPIALLISAPVALIVFPLMYTLLGLGGRPSGQTFALVGGLIGMAISAYALFRFRGAIALSPSIMFIALPLLVIGATLLGVIAGFMFERMARRAPQPIPPLSTLSSDDVIAPLNKDDLPKAPPRP